MDIGRNRGFNFIFIMKKPRIYGAFCHLIISFIRLPISAGLCDYMNSAFGHDPHFSSSSIVSAANNSTCMSHTTTRRSSLPCDKANNRLLFPILLSNKLLQLPCHLPISPIITIASVSASFIKSSTASFVVVPNDQITANANRWLKYQDLLSPPGRLPSYVSVPDFETIPILPFLKTKPGMIPTLHSSAVITPGQFGPTNLAFVDFKSFSLSPYPAREFLR